MDIIRKTIYNSWFYNWILRICQLSNSSFFFKAEIDTKVKEKRDFVRETAIYHFLITLDQWLEKMFVPIRKAFYESVIIGFIGRVLKYFTTHTLIGRLLKEFNIVYLVPLYIYINFFLRAYLPSVAGAWDELFALGIIGWLFALRVIRNKRYRMSAMDLPIVVFAGAYLILVFIKSPEFDVAIEGYRAVVQYMFWFFLVYQLLDTKKKAYRMTWMFVFAIALLGLHGIYQFFTNAPMLGNWVDSGETVTTRAYSIALSPNAYGSLMILNVPLSFGMFLYEKDIIKKLVALIATVFTGLGLIFSFSRGAWIMAFLGVMVLIFFVGKRLLLPIASITLAAILNVNQIWSRLIYLFSPEYAEKSARGGRIYRWSTGLMEWSEHKMLGLGIGRYGGAVATNHKLAPFYMDNFYLKTLTESGILGLTSLLLLLLVMVRQTYVAIKNTTSKETRILMFGIFGSILGVLGHNFNENIFEIPYMVTYTWSYVAIILAMNRLDREETQA